MKMVTFLASFRWKFLLVRILSNAVALVIVALVLPNVSAPSATLGHILLLALVLGILNAVLKPVVQFLTLPFLFASYGLIIVLINAVMLYVLSLLFPNYFVVNNLLAALVAGLLFGIIASFLENLFGLPRPILGDNQEELRKRVEATEGRSLARRVFPSAESPLETLPASELLTMDEPAAPGQSVPEGAEGPSENMSPATGEALVGAPAGESQGAEGAAKAEGDGLTSEAKGQLAGGDADLAPASSDSPDEELAPPVRKARKAKTKHPEALPTEESEATKAGQSKEGES